MELNDAAGSPGYPFSLDGPHSPDETHRVADLAAECVRYLNHATMPGQGGLVDPADAYQLLGDLTVAAERIPQLVGQIARYLRDQAATGRLADTRRPDGNLWARVVANDLDGAAEYAGEMARQLGRRHSELSGLYVRTGPEKPGSQ